MQKYGFREGQGLGKHEQGLSTALSVEKTSKRGGKIIIGDAAEKRTSLPPSIASFYSPPVSQSFHLSVSSSLSLLTQPSPFSLSISFFSLGRVLFTGFYLFPVIFCHYDTVLTGSPGASCEQLSLMCL